MTRQSPAELWKIPTSRPHPGTVKSDHETCGPGIWAFNVPRWFKARWKVSTANSATRLQEGGNNCSPKPLPKLGWDAGSGSVEFPPAAPSTQTLALCVCVLQHENPQKELLWVLEVIMCYRRSETYGVKDSVPSRQMWRESKGGHCPPWSISPIGYVVPKPVLQISL